MRRSRHEVLRCADYNSHLWLSKDRETLIGEIGGLTPVLDPGLPFDLNPDRFGPPLSLCWSSLRVEKIPWVGGSSKTSVSWKICLIEVSKSWTLTVIHPTDFTVFRFYVYVTNGSWIEVSAQFHSTGWRGVRREPPCCAETVKVKFLSVHKRVVVRDPSLLWKKRNWEGR